MPEQLGRLVQVRRIGVGGFASVWLYRDEQLDSFVAVKALADNWAQQLDVRERFLEEARVMRRAASDHVVGVHDFGETDDGTPYFVMTYADRGTVADLLRSGPPGIDVTVDLIEQACRGVADLHASGVVHRDIKPPNLLLRSDRHGGSRLLVADLGLSKAMMYASGLTQIVGTPAYMAPEQGIPGGGVDERADVHALGAVAYHLLSGRPMRDVAIRDIGSAMAPEPLSQRAAVPADLSDVVARAVQPDPADRWPDAAAFATALRHAIGGSAPAQLAAAPGGADDGLHTDSGTRIDTPTGTLVAGSPAAPPPRSRRRTVGVVLAAIAVIAAAGLGLLALRDDDPATGDQAGPTSGDASPDQSDSPDTSGTSGPASEVTLDPDVKPADRQYCRQVIHTSTTLTSLDASRDDFLPDLQEATDIIHAASQAAPPATADAWRRFDRPFQDLRRAQDRIGLTLEDLRDLGDALSPNDPKVKRLSAAAERFQQDMDALQDTEQIGARIRSDAAVRCRVDIQELW